MFATAVISGSILYGLSADALNKAVRADLMRIAHAASTVIDVRLHETFVSPLQETTTAYTNAIAPLERMRVAAGDVRFIYTCVMKSNRVHFVLDPTPPGDADRDGVDDKSHVMQIYDEASEQLVAALRTGQPGADREPYTDSWGTFISGYAPFRDDRGQVIGLVGVDLDARAYVQRLARMRRAAWSGLGAAFVLSVIAGAGFHLMQRRIEQFRARLRQMNADLERRVVQRTAELEASRKKLEDEVAERTRAEAAAVQACEATGHANFLLEQSLASAEQLTIQARAASRAKSEFLATMSHELRTPINGILGYTDLLSGSPIDDDQAECINTIRTSGESLLLIIDDILDFSRIEAGRMVLQTEAYDPRKVLNDVAGFFAFQARQKKLELTVTLASDLPSQCIGDAARVRQVLMNLIGNAVKFTESGRVRVEATAGNCSGREDRGAVRAGPSTESMSFIRFVITDTGIGIPESKRNLLFKEFTQVDSTDARKHGGTGLGLAICKRLVHLMGGQIGMESAPGCGSTFWFTLPVDSLTRHDNNPVLLASDSPTSAPVRAA